MLLNEAVQKARKDLGLSQKKLAELAGIQRKQLATLEAGGNVTLATLRKVLAHLPNLETFTLDAVTATVRREVPPEEQRKAVESAMRMLGTALHSLVDALAEGKLPDEGKEGLKQANEILYQGLGYSLEDLERDRQKLSAELTPQEPLTKENAAEALAAIAEAAEAGLAELGLSNAPSDDELPSEHEDHSG
ncbi:MAG TPA: helix-turn-helix domain-containing protein [Thermoanaerobaculia bacterium]|jgi:transcriptional regulator with XRE-family HTH domain|nr:helix-turn-helix domain-containing protein [Thermoanaerobaculia bacterium]